jgi:hypothetical protein
MTEEIKADIAVLKQGHKDMRTGLKDLQVALYDMAQSNTALNTTMRLHVEAQAKEGVKFANIFDRLSTMEKLIAKHSVIIGALIFVAGASTVILLKNYLSTTM